MSRATIQTRRGSRRWPAYPALVRGDDGGVHVRTFASAAQAGEAAVGNAALDFEHRDTVVMEAAKAWKNLGSPADLSRTLGGKPSAATITRLCKTGGLPCRDDGAGPYLARYRLPVKAIVASVLQVGLRATVARHRAGALIA